MSRQAFAPQHWPGWDSQSGQQVESLITGLDARLRALEAAPASTYRVGHATYTIQPASTTLLPLNSVLDTAVDREAQSEVVLTLVNTSGGVFTFTGIAADQRAPRLRVVVLGATVQFAHLSAFVTEYEQCHCPGGVTLALTAGSGHLFLGYARDTQFSRPGVGWFSAS